MAADRFTFPGIPPLLVGRERERTVLRDHLAAALAGQGSTILLSGEAGIGKTALAEDLAREASQHGTSVLIGRCYDVSETPPYAPWLEIFARYRQADGLPPLPAAFSQRGMVGTVPSQAALFNQVQDFLTELSTRRPLMLVLDDLQWADPASLELLRVIARDLASHAILIVATYRADETTSGGALHQHLPAIIREANAARMGVRRLDEDDVRALVEQRFSFNGHDDRRLVAYLQERGEGNPFFIGELLRTLEEEGILREGAQGWALGDLRTMRVPSLVRQVVTGRLARLSKETRRLLAVGAVIGQDVPLALWATVVEESEETLLAVIEQAMEAHFLVASADTGHIRFVHALIRETLDENMPISQRRTWHRRVAEVLAARPAPDPDAVANHFGRAGDARAFAWLVHAGLRAERAAAWLTAADRFAAAAELPDGDGARARARGWLLFCRGHLLLFSDHAQSLDALDAAEPLAQTVGDCALTAYVRFTRGQIRCLGRSIRQGLAEMEQAVAELDALPDAYRLRPMQAMALATLAALFADGERPAPVPVHMPTVPMMTPYRANLVVWLGHAGRYREALAMGEALIAALAAAPGDDQPGQGATTQLGLGHAHAALGRPTAARRAYALSRAGQYAINNAFMVAFTVWCELLLAVLPYEADDPAERTRLAAEAATAWERARGTITAMSHDAIEDLLPALVEGRWATATRLAQGGLAAAVTAHSQGAIVALGVLARHRGEPDRAWERVRALHPAGPETEPGDSHFHHAIMAQALAAELALDAGDLITAADWVAAHGRWLDWSGAVLWRAEHQLLQARHARASGERERAWEHAKAALRQASEPRQPLRLLAAHRLLGELATEMGQYDDAAAHLDAALALADGCAAPFERALTLLASAELRVASGRPADARADLEVAQAICEPLGAEPALARAARLGAMVPPQPFYPNSLTAREVDVLRLIAAGSSNREIATILSISTRTVNRHVENLYQKIDAHGRADATAYAFRHHLT